MHIKIPTLVAVLVFVIPLPSTTFATAGSPTAIQVRMSEGKPFDQEFIVTAYYSPVPKQCGYAMGDFEADTILNGGGILSADGTPVYAGMAAAPPTYPFGTRIVLPGIGSFTVHDRGSAIQEHTTVRPIGSFGQAHRLDLWVGTGEEGLARALEFGVQPLHAIVYPPYSASPAESFNLLSLPAPPAVLRPYLTNNANITDCESMLTFGKTLIEKTRLYTQTHTRFAFDTASIENDLTFSIVAPSV